MCHLTLKQYNIVSRDHLSDLIIVFFFFFFFFFFFIFHQNDGTCVDGQKSAKTCSLRKQAYSNILKILPPKKKTENFQIKNLIFFHISAQNIDCGYSLEPPRRGGSNEYPQSIFLSGNKENNVYPYKPQFCYIKVGFKGVKTI